MDERGQFTFYRSYYEAIKQLPKEDQADIMMAICAYALDETMPDLDGVPSAIFTLIKPTLDSGRKKANNRRRDNTTGEDKNKPQTNGEQNDNKTGTNKEQNDNKTITNEKQTANEREREREIEIEIENECYKEKDTFGIQKERVNRREERRQELHGYVAEHITDESVAKAARDWIDARLERKKDDWPTIKGVELAFAKLSKLSMSADDVVKCFNDSVINGWKGIFPEKVVGGRGT